MAYIQLRLFDFNSSSWILIGVVYALTFVPLSIRKIRSDKKLRTERGGSLWRVLFLLLGMPFSGNGGTLLMRAAFSGELKIAKFLLKEINFKGVSIKKSTNVNTKDNYGSTALMLAAYSGYSDIMKLLLENKANVNVTDIHGKTALKYAEENGHSELVKILIEFGADKS